jgi:ribosome-binding factor A
MTSKRTTSSQRRYPRTARVNELLREVIADTLERLDDVRIALVTVTGVTADPDLRHATVWFSALDPRGLGEARVDEALAEHRVAVQAAIGRQVRMKRTPELAFKRDPAISTGQRVEEIISHLHEAEQE